MLTFHQKGLRHGAKPTDSKTYELVVNYRSHGGIVNCARSVVELITQYWPHSIDSLQPERASVDGFRPIFFSGQGNVVSFLYIVLPFINQRDISAYSVISRGLSLVMARENRLSSEQINVSAAFLSSKTILMRLNPGILVRDDAARQQLKEKLGESIIM